MTTILKNRKLADNLSERTVVFLQNHIASLSHTQKDALLLKDWADNSNKIWKYPRVCFDTFIDSPQYLGLVKEGGASLVYPEIRNICNAVIDGDYRELVMVAGIGGGKTTVLELLACYYAYELLCYWDPHGYFSLLSDKPITLINMGTTATQALDNAFSGIKSFIKKSPFFMGHTPIILQGSIRFPKQNILLLSGNSKATTPLGYNIYYAGLDEAAFYMDNDNKCVAEDIYTALQRRIVSRFKDKGLALMISSPQYDGDFVMRKLQEAQQVPKQIFSTHSPTWKLKPISEEDKKDIFYLNSKTNKIVDTISPAQTISKIGDPFEVGATIWEIPKQYKRDFIVDPEKAKRDYAAVPGKAIDAFMPQIDLIEKMFTDRESPLQANGSYTFPDEDPLRANYYIHVDLALNRHNKGDFAGLAMCHFEGFEEDKELGERRKKVVIDLAERIEAGAGGEIDFEEVRKKIYVLKTMGFAIKKVTLDAFQCCRRNTKILTIENSVASLYNKGSINNQKDMPLKNESKVPLLAGEEKNIQDLKEGDYVYSLDRDKSIKAGRVKAVWCSGHKEIYRVHIDNGKFVDCSDNHPFMLRDGSYVRADKLQEGANLMPLYRQRERVGYEKTFNPKTKSYRHTHRLVMGASGRSNIVHHKDENKSNNIPDNLEIMKNSIHCKHHWTEERKRLTSKQRSISNKLIKPRLGTKTSGQGRKNLSEASKKIWQDPKHRAKMMLRDTAHHGEDHPQYDKNLTIDILQQYKDKKLVEVCRILNTTPRKVRNRINTLGYKTWKEFSSSPVNHRVVKVEKLNIQDETWDIEIEGTHNFATSAGVFVHNSVDTIQILKKKGIRAEYLSVDRGIEPYQTLKECIYGGNIQCHKMDVLLDELSRLEITKAQKVDHPPGSSKDVADAVCGAVYMCVKESGEEMGMSAGAYYPKNEGESASMGVPESKEDYYRRLEELNSKGLLA